MSDLLEAFQLFGTILLKGDEGVDKKLNSIDKEAKQTGNSFDHLEKKSGLLGKALKGLAGYVGGVAIFDALKNGIKATVGAGIEFDSQMEQNKIAFDTMLGSADKSTKLLDELSKMAANTPFEFPQLTEASKKLLAFGFTAEQIPGMLTSIGDASAGLGIGADGVSRLTLAIGQMSAKGKIAGGEMMQLTEAGVPAWDILAKAMGKSTAEVMKLSEQGLIPADKGIKMLVDGMEQRFPHMMDKQSKSFSGLISTIKDNTQQAFGAVMKPAFEWLTSDALPKVVDITGSMGNKVQGFMSTIGSFASIIGKSVVSVVAPIKDEVAPIVQKVIEYVVTNLPQIQATAMTVFTNASESVKILWDSVIRLIMPALKSLWEFIEPNLPAIQTLFFSAFDEASKIMKVAASGISDLTKIISENWDVIEPILVGVGAAFGAFKLYKMGLAIATTATTVWTAATEIAATSGEIFAVVMGTINIPVLLVVAAIGALVAIGWVLYKHWDQIKLKATELKEKFDGFKKSVIELKDQAIDKLREKFEDFGKKLVEFKDNILEKIDKKFDDFKKTINDNKTAIQNTATVLGVVFGPALVKTGVQATIAAGKITGSFIVSLINTGKEAAVQGAKITASFVVSLINTGKEAIISGGKITASFAVSLIKAGKEAVISGGKITGSLVASMVTTGKQATIAAGKIAIDFIASLISASKQAVITAASITGDLIVAIGKYIIEGYKAAAATGAQILAWAAQKLASAGATIGLVAQTVATWALNGAMAAGTVAAGVFKAAIAFLTGPFGLIVIAITAVIAVGVLLYKNWDTVKAKAIELKDSVVEKFEGIRDKIREIKDQVVVFLENMFKFKIPHIPLPHFKFTGEFSLSPPSVPKFSGVEWYARGTQYAKGGRTVLGEEGPEEVILPQGSQVKNAQQTKASQEKNAEIFLIIDGEVMGRALIPHINRLQGKQYKISMRGAGLK